jgi:Zn finger protein HypA/HybF involved in hydrogenase expression
MATYVRARNVASKRFPVVCLECGKKFLTARVIPECPRCGGVDVELREG